MVSFRSPAKQAARVMKALQVDHIRSVGTARNYEQRLTRVSEFIQEHKLGIALFELTPDQAIDYLDVRGMEVGQKTLDMERQAIQKMMHDHSHQLAPDEKLPVIKSELDQALGSRFYTPEQVDVVVAHQTERNALSTEIAHAAGLRAHELITIQRIEEREPDPRPALDSKFNELGSARYVVHGKGGLKREIRLPDALTERLEARRLESPRPIVDRNINYQQYYNINGGKRWSNSFSAASKHAMGWSRGAHGLRHSYAQSRMKTLQRTLPYEQALETVSQEMGHFRPEITKVYLR